MTGATGGSGTITDPWTNFETNRFSFAGWAEMYIREEIYDPSFLGDEQYLATSAFVACLTIYGEWRQQGMGTGADLQERLTMVDGSGQEYRPLPLLGNGQGSLTPITAETEVRPGEEIGGNLCYSVPETDSGPDATTYLVRVDDEYISP